MKPLLWFAAGLAVLILLFGYVDGWAPIWMAFTEVP